MPRLLSRLTRAVLCLSIVSCAPAGGAYPASSAEQGSGRYRVLIPDPQALGGVASRDAERVGARLRSAFTQMLRHTAVDQRAARGAMRQYGIESLDPTTARQLAQQIGAANVLFVEMSPGGSGLQADAQFIDVASGDVLRYDDLTGADADQLSAGILARVEQSIEGILQAGSCNDYLSSSQPERALTACEAALAIVPTSSAALYGKATALLHLERHDEALQSYRELLERESANQEALLGAGLAASHLGRSDEALQFYNRYLELDPENLEVRKTVAHQVATAGDYVAAYRVLEPAFDDSASVGNAEFQRYLFSLAAAAGQRAASGNEAEGREFYQTAMQAYQRAFSADSARPDATQIRQAIGVMNALGRVEDALSLAREATVRFDTVAVIWSQYASVLASVERQSEAAQALTRVIELDPDAENAYLRRGMAYLAAGQRQQGLDDLRRAAERGNGEQAAVVMFQQGVRAGEAGRWAEAGDLLESATRYAAASVRPQVVFYHGYVLYKQGEAIAKANTSASAAPAREALSLFQRALPLLQQGESPQKQQMLQVIQQYIANQEAIIQAAAR